MKTVKVYSLNNFPIYHRAVLTIVIICTITNTYLCYNWKCTPFDHLPPIPPPITWPLVIHLWSLMHCWWKYSLVQPLWKALCSCLKKIKNFTALWLSDSTSGIISEETKTLIWKNICTPMFIAVLFTIAKVWKQPKCPSVDGVQKTWGIFTQWNTTWP